MKQNNWITSCTQNEAERARETLIWLESVTEKETGNAQPGACVDVLPRCSPRVAISFFFCFNSSHTDFVIFKNNLHSTSLQKLLTALICRSQYYCTGRALIRQGRASIRLFTVSGAVMTVFCRRGCISIASQTVDKGVNCVTIIICSKKISAQNMTWQLTKSAE